MEKNKKQKNNNNNRRIYAILSIQTKNIAPKGTSMAYTHFVVLLFNQVLFFKKKKKYQNNKYESTIYAGIVDIGAAISTHISYFPTHILMTILNQIVLHHAFTSFYIQYYPSSKCESNIRIQREIYESNMFPTVIFTLKQKKNVEKE